MVPDILAWLGDPRAFFKDFAGPIATAIASATAATVAWRLGRGQLQIANAQKLIAEQQRSLAADRFRYDLFKDRFRCYEDVARFLEEAPFLSPIRNPKEDMAQFNKLFREFSKSLQMAWFLFPDDIREYLESLRARVVKLRQLEIKLEAVRQTDGATTDHVFSELDKVMGAFLGEEERARKAFEPYLSFGHVRRPDGGKI
jgi:hypothetical protein